MSTEKKSNSKNDKKKVMYPSAEILQNTCYEDYRRVLETYDKIYEKVNIALAFSGIILLVIMSSFDYTIVVRICSCNSTLGLFSLLLYFLCSLASAVLIIWAVIQLLLLMKSKPLKVFDSISARNEELYYKQVDVTSMWLIDKYTKAIVALRLEIEEKQQRFDAAVTMIVVALLIYAFEVVIKKGL